MHVEGGIHHPAGLPPAGTLVGGKYRLERYIAEGGMGVIALARHVDLDEPVALKFLKPDIVCADLTGTVAGRFVREARATIKIRSEHVPRIFDVTTLETGVPYIVMELLVGEDLDRRLESQGPLPIVFAVDLLLQSLEALAAAHSLGIVHRDFKPANLFLAKSLDGTACVKVLDFGIAKLVDQNGTGRDHGLTETNAVMGSPRYMAPEQMRSTRDVDARADIWAVGTTLYELLTGIAPFTGESLTQVCAAILQDEPDAMSRRRPDVPAGLEAVVRRCLAKRADDRYGNVADLAAALAPFGTAPSGHEIASRIARMLGAAPPRVFSTPSLAVPRASIPDAQTIAAIPSGSSSSGIGMTNTSWGATDASSQIRRRRVWTIASVFAVLFVAGGVLGGMALFRSHTPHRSAIAGAGTHVAPSILSSSAAPTTGTVEEAPPPASADVPASASVAAPSSAPSASTAMAAGSTEKPRSKTSADPKPTSTAGPKTTTAARPTPSPTGGLWDDRK